MKLTIKILITCILIFAVTSCKINKIKNGEREGKWIHIDTIDNVVYKSIGRYKKGIEQKIPYIIYNGDEEKRLVNNINFCFRFIEGEGLILMLDFKGISSSSGSACTSGSLDPSHVLLALGLPHEIAHGSLRLTFGRDNSLDDVDYIVDTIADVVFKLRQMSPLYETFIKTNQANDNQ